ncbi:MAG: hypothetical protein WC713_00885 [Candidatus Methylomirabilota bacterium]|jgi:hypothetical protein
MAIKHDESDLSDLGATPSDLSDLGAVEVVEPVRDTRNTISEFARPVLEAGGSAVGMAIAGGAAAPTVAGVIPGAIAGGGLGFAAGKSAADILDRSMGIKKPIESIRQAGIETAQNLEAGAGAEAIGLGMGGVVRGVAGALRPVAERTTGVAKAVRAAMAAKITPTMTQILQSKPMAQAEEVLSRLPFIGRRIIAMRDAQESAYQAVRSQVLESAGPNVAPSKLGITIRDRLEDVVSKREINRMAAISKEREKLLGKAGSETTAERLAAEYNEIMARRIEASRKAKNKFFDKVGEEIPDEADQVLTTNLEAATRKHLEITDRIPRAFSSETKGLLSDLASGPAGKMVDDSGKLLKGDAAAEAQALISGRKSWTFKEVTTLREIINGRLNEAMRTGNTKESAVWRNAKDALDKDIEAFSETLTGDIKKKYDLAIAYYRDIYKGKFATKQNIDLMKVAKANPQMFYENVVKPGNYVDIAKTREVAGPGVMDKMRRLFLEDMTTGQDGRALSGPEILNKIGGYSKEAILELLTPSQYDELLKYQANRESPRFIESQIEMNLRKIIRKSGDMYVHPEDVVTRIADGDVMTYRAVKRIVGEKGTAPIKRRILEGIIGEIHDPTVLAGQQNKTAFGMRKALKAYDENFLKEVFGKNMLDDISKIDDMKALLESQQRLLANPSGTGGMVVSNNALFGMGAVFGFVGPGAATAVAVGAGVASALMTSETARKLLIRGLDPANAKNAELYSKLISQVVAAKIDLAKEKRATSGVGNK